MSKWVWWDAGPDGGYRVGPDGKGALAMVFTVEEAQALCREANGQMPGLQARGAAWVRSTFGDANLTDRTERATRVLEEAVELAQACGVGLGRCGAVMERVYGRPPGEPRLEAIGALFTVLMFCESQGVDPLAGLLAEIERVEDPALRERIRRKHEEKVAAGIGLPLKGEA